MLLCSRVFAISMIVLAPCLVHSQGNADLSPSASTSEEDHSPSKDGHEKETWSIETPPGPSAEQPIDVSEGTWMTVDVHPTGCEIVFDLLGDIYVMPITGADGNDCYPEKLTSGIAWDMQPRFSHDGKWIAFTSDRNGKGGKAGDNIWIIERATKELRQITN